MTLRWHILQDCLGMSWMPWSLGPPDTLPFCGRVTRGLEWQQTLYERWVRLSSLCLLILYFATHFPIIFHTFPLQVVDTCDLQGICCTSWQSYCKTNSRNLSNQPSSITGHPISQHETTLRFLIILVISVASLFWYIMIYTLPVTFCRYSTSYGVFFKHQFWHTPENHQAFKSRFMNLPDCVVGKCEQFRVTLVFPWTVWQISFYPKEEPTKIYKNNIQKHSAALHWGLASFLIFTQH